MTGTERLIKDLTSKLKHLCFMYHTLGVSEVSDSIYDAMFKQLQDLELTHPEYVQSDSPTSRVGSIEQAQSKTISMSTPMLSIRTHTDCDSDSALGFDTYIRSQLSIDEVEYCCELKYDGLGINLRYRKGELVSANVRGDGYSGEDVSHSIFSLGSIPKSLQTASPPEFIEIRGECLFFREDFDDLNARLQERIDSGIKGIKCYSNVRNAAAGLIRRGDISLVASSNLQFFAYTIGQSTEFEPPGSQSQLLDLLQSWGFRSTAKEVTKDPRLLSKWHSLVLGKREQLEFDIDGVVYKVNDVCLQTKLGYNTREPKWALAHKFAPREKMTRIKSIAMQVGRTGKITPVATLEPVVIDGVTVSRVTLHNEDDMRKKDIDIGDTVMVGRGGDVIPKILATVKDAQAGPSAFSIYDQLAGKCPSCSSPIVKVGANWRCTAGASCSAQTAEVLLHFCSKRMMAINGLGDKVIQSLVDAGILKTSSDIYHLDVERFVSVGMSPLVASNILKEIEKSKATTLQRFLYALGIPCVGEATSEVLAVTYPDISMLIQASVEDLCRMPDIGESTAQLIYAYFKDDVNVRNIQCLRDAGVYWSIPHASSSVLDGKVFVLTGTLATMSRDTAMTTIKDLGGKISGTVTSKVDYVLAGDNAGDKLEKAGVMGITILDEDSFLMMIRQ